MKTEYEYTGYTQKNGVVSKVIKKCIFALHGHNIHCQQWELPKFLMRSLQSFNVCMHFGSHDTHTVIKLMPDVV
jgi:hypothetical protein